MLESPIHGSKISFFSGFDSTPTIYGNVVHTPTRHILAQNDAF